VNLLFTLKNELKIQNATGPLDGGRAIVHPVRRKKTAARLAFALAAIVGLGIQIHAGVLREASEYNLAPALPGDQMRSDMAIGPNGGYLVWEDNYSDGDGLSVNLRKLTSTLSGQLNVISLATQTAGNQEHPRVSALARGGAAFVWQSGEDSAQQVFLRVMTGSDQFVGPEIAVSSHTNADQQNAAVAGLSNGNIAVVWSAYDVDGDMSGVFAALFGPAGQRIGAEFQVNQVSQFNQRNPVVTAVPGGGFVVSWVSESQRTANSVDIYARVYNSAGGPSTGEFRVNTANRVCSSPSIAATSAGNFTIAWSEIDQDAAVNDIVTPVNSSVGWDIYASSFTSIGSRLGEVRRLNQQTAGTQANPSVATVGDSQMVVWTSFGQDGDRESIVGRALTAVGAPDADEFVVNTATAGRQIQPVVRGNNDGRFVVSWSTFTGVAENYEIRAQRYVAGSTLPALQAPPAPFVSALSMTRLSVAWPPVDGFDVANFELYVDGSTTPTIVTGTMATVTVPPSTEHSFTVAYRLRDGQLSPLSAAASGKAFGSDDNFDGLPDDWQAKYWGSNKAAWPKPNDDTDHDGMSNLEEFLAGTDPTQAGSVLKTQVVATPQGWRLSWNTTAGLVYQVQQTSDFETWTTFSGQRFAPGTNDSVSVPIGSSLGYYRVIRIR